MKQCYETEEFILPETVSKIEPKENELLTFSDDENEVNLRRCRKQKFYDQAVCRHLCSKTLVLESTMNKPISPCESICFKLTKSFDSAGEVCPYEKYCIRGCPCPFYKCEKLESPQKLFPVFDLQANPPNATILDEDKLKDTNGQVKTITGRWDTRRSEKKKDLKMILFNLDGKSQQINTNNFGKDDTFYSYERFSDKLRLSMYSL